MIEIFDMGCQTMIFWKSMRLIATFNIDNTPLHWLSYCYQSSTPQVNPDICSVKEKGGTQEFDDKDVDSEEVK